MQEYQVIQDGFPPREAVFFNRAKAAGLERPSVMKKRVGVDVRLIRKVLVLESPLQPGYPLLGWEKQIPIRHD